MDEKDAESLADQAERGAPTSTTPAEPDRDHIAGQLDQARRGIEGVSAEGAHARG
jgi:hypothetical protein